MMPTSGDRQRRDMELGVEHYIGDGLYARWDGVDCVLSKRADMADHLRRELCRFTPNSLSEFLRRVGEQQAREREAICTCPPDLGHGIIAHQAWPGRHSLDHLPDCATQAMFAETIELSLGGAGDGGEAFDAI